MDEVYEELELLYRNDEGKKYYKKLLDAYITNESSSTKTFTYRSEELKFSIGSHIVADYAFACLTRRRDDDKIVFYYISDERNVNDALDVQTEGHVAARFVCQMTFNVCSIVAIAEEPATAIATPKYGVEHIYLQMRTFYKPGETSLHHFIAVYYIPVIL